MHGGERKDGSSGYLSISMPNTFSMSPEYVRRFVQTKQLNREFRDVFQILKEKSKRTFEKHKKLKQKGEVFKADVKTLSINEQLTDYKKKVSLIVTSPPYLGIVNYAKQNWIRAWLFDKDPLEVHKELDDDLNLNEWVAFAKSFIVELKQFLKRDGVAVFVIGDVAKSKNNVIPLAREFCHIIKDNNYFKYLWCFSDSIDDAYKTTRIWGETKGSATATDRIVIVSDINPFEKFKDKTGFEHLDFATIQKLTKKFT
jgi:site-specific DNA-methyltransferase (adenine-specific)